MNKIWEREVKGRMKMTRRKGTGERGEKVKNHSGRGREGKTKTVNRRERGGRGGESDRKKPK